MKDRTKALAGIILPIAATFALVGVGILGAQQATKPQQQKTTEAGINAAYNDGTVARLEVEYQAALAAYDRIEYEQDSTRFDSLENRVSDLKDSLADFGWRE